MEKRKDKKNIQDAKEEKCKGESWKRIKISLESRLSLKRRRERGGVEEKRKEREKRRLEKG